MIVGEDIIAHHIRKKGCIAEGGLSAMYPHFYRFYTNIFHRLAIYHPSEKDYLCHFTLSLDFAPYPERHYVTAQEVAQWAEVFLRQHEKRPLFDHQKVSETVVQKLATGYASERI